MKDELRIYKDYVRYNTGYRIVYLYKDHHEAPEKLYSKDIDGLIKLIDSSLSFKSIDDTLNRFLKLNPKARGVSIYGVDGTLIKKKIKPNVQIIDDKKVYQAELMYGTYEKKADQGYRIVYFYPDGEYSLDAYAPKLEYFMSEFTEYDPEKDDLIIPKFKSVDDLLNRLIDSTDEFSSVGIYNVDGTLIGSKSK